MSNHKIRVERVLESSGVTFTPEKVSDKYTGYSDIDERLFRLYCEQVEKEYHNEPYDDVIKNQDVLLHEGNLRFIMGVLRK